MKKFFLGCGILALILVGVGAYFIAKFAKGFKVYMEQAAAVSQTYDNLNVEFPYTPPADGKLTLAQLDNWLAIRQGLMGAIGNMQAQMNQIQGFGDLAKIAEQGIATAEKHAESLAAASMSPREYDWIAGQVLGALFSGDARNNPDYAALTRGLDDVSQTLSSAAGNQNLGSFKDMGAVMTSEEIRHTLELIAVRKDEILATLPAFHFDYFLNGFVTGNLQMPATPAAAPQDASAPAEATPAPVEADMTPSGAL